MIVKEEVWESIPLLHVYEEEMDEHTPVVIFLHGFLSAKEHNLHYAYQLVEKGIRVLLPDAILHGKRSENLNENQMNMKFWEIVLQSIKEVHTLHEQLKFKNIIVHDQIGIAGTSMGGIVTSGCLAIYQWIKTAGICMGTTSYTKLAQYQVELLKAKGITLPIVDEQQQAVIAKLAPFNFEEHEDVWKQCPIIFWHGEKDAVVPFNMSHEYYEHLVEINSMKQIQYISEPKAGHTVSREGMLQVTQFLAQHLA
ncbi:prolyl oligopeptidase family serine peptidase [Solibacillus sp. FSL R7-0682]|uniref:prolyl oligopeptidase family serine peptidase n=1 Tax=Solibacillus sp. FSL R7-0682 TaxID=2921690 RepID=UPI0030FD116A